MRTRSRSKRPVEGESGAHDDGRATSRKDSGGNRRQDSKPSIKKSINKGEEPSSAKRKGKVNAELSHDAGVKGCSSGSAREGTVKEEGNGGATGHCEASEMDWEEGTVECREVYSHDIGKEVTVEFTDLPSAERKISRRASAEEKELAELVHKVHLLCLLARGRMVDKACNDPLIQASILSLLPSNLLKIAEVPNLTANKLGSLVNWFHSKFHLTSECIDRGSFESNLAFALQNHEGTAEEVAALSVALFRALNLTTRFISVLDVASLKPDADIPGILNHDVPRLDARISSFTTIVEGTNQTNNTPSPVNSMDSPKDNTTHRIPQRNKCDMKDCNLICKNNLLKVLSGNNLDDGTSNTSVGKACIDNSPSSTTKSAERAKRKGDLEFELQLSMALSATAAGIRDSNVDAQMDELTGTSPSLTLPLKKYRKSKAGEPSKVCSSNAIWSRRTGPPLFWAEVYCGGETLTGRWVHVDAANAIIDGEAKVEAAAAVCRRPLKYVVAFAGNGAKDVTRRYCMQWYKIASRRINSEWWDKVLAPLKELESSATGGMVQLQLQEESPSKLKGKGPGVPCPSEMNSVDPNSTSQDCTESISMEDDRGGDASELITKSRVLKPPVQNPEISCIEDMELETRALTEPLPTNQLAYKSHHLYAIERWLTKNQILHPKGPVLGYCSGHPVFPRSCVQTLQTRQKWLREGLQVRPNEIPAKIVKSSKKVVKFQSYEPSVPEEEGEPSVELYGKWQLEPLQLPHAANGIVPKNERGQVEVWSEKCVPPGTVHLRLPRLVPVAKRLEIDYAPAMVGFEFRNGRSFPIFEGIVVCAEFKDAILEAYVEVEERRESDERKRNEAQALSRWFQLLSSIITRQRLKNSYVDSSSINGPHKSPEGLKNNHQFGSKRSNSEDEVSPRGAHERLVPKAKPVLTSHEHEHVFPVENETFDEEVLVRTKRCPCGFSIQVEEL